MSITDLCQDINCSEVFLDFFITPNTTTASFLFIIHSIILQLDSTESDLLTSFLKIPHLECGWQAYHIIQDRSNLNNTCHVCPQKKIIFSFILLTKVCASYTRLPWVITCLPLKCTGDWPCEPYAGNCMLHFRNLNVHAKPDKLQLSQSTHGIYNCQQKG